MNSRPLSYWEHPLPAAPKACEIPAHVDILIVGAGFMGSWLALFLAETQPSASILVVERDVFTLGASSRNAGFLTCGHVSEMLDDMDDARDEVVLSSFDLRRRGVKLVRARFGDMLEPPCGAFDADELTDEKRALATRLNERAGREVYVERDVRYCGETVPRLVNVDDGGLHPVRVLEAVRRRTKGVAWSFETSATLVSEGHAVFTRAGDVHRVTYKRGFICTNAATRDLLPSSTIEPGRGQVIVTSPLTDCATDAMLGYRHGGYDYFRFVDRRLLIGGGRHVFRGDEACFDVSPTRPVRDYLEARAREIIGHDNWRTEHHWAGVMGFPGGHHLGEPTRRRLDACTELLAGFGGMGVACTPVMAQDVAREV